MSGKANELGMAAVGGSQQALVVRLVVSWSKLSWRLTG
jgi:hypothetical protein